VLLPGAMLYFKPYILVSSYTMSPPMVRCKPQSRPSDRLLAALLAMLLSSTLLAGYKARPWQIRAADSYASRLTSEGVTIAVEPLFRDDLAAVVFDKNDIVTRGIIPLAVAIFNGNDFPVRVDAETAELINGDERLHTLQPAEVVARVFKKGSKGNWIPQPIPKVSTGDSQNEEALMDFEHKYLGGKVIPAHASGGGFLYFSVPANDPGVYLLASRLYLPDVNRDDTGSNMIFFEIELRPAVEAAPARPRK
jgi:hypothetical protein